MTSERPDLEGLEDRIRQWGRRPPNTAAATAARRVVARLGARPGAREESRPWLRRVAFAAAASLAALALWFVLAQPPRSVPESASVDLPPTLPENVVMFWLDADTPVYFVTGPPDPVERGLP